MRWNPAVVHSERSDGSLVLMVGHPLVDACLAFEIARGSTEDRIPHIMATDHVPGVLDRLAG